MRGKRHSGWAYHCARRIIPAHAGQTLRRHPPRRLTPDHPRACGANAGTCFTSCASVGSSPRMRGKRCDPSPRRRPRRIIPAHAGQTSQLEHSVYSPADHPRACGANQVILEDRRPHGGSSPRMRGKRFVGRDAIKMHRIIPAHAGQTGLTFPGWGRTSDHPRACGANAYRTSNRSKSTGSSPRMRGKLTVDYCFDFVLRIIPAHAGQTVLPALQPLMSADHPRACGANIRCAGRRSGGDRIIPAHAGQTYDV